jgi:PPOX class probable F420-dependent enzyme
MSSSWTVIRVFPIRGFPPSQGTVLGSLTYRLLVDLALRRPYDPSVIDQSTEFGARVARHLREETVLWLTTVTPAGSPLPSPVWFLWDGGESVLMYSLPGARVRNIEANPRVALNFAGDGRGGDIVILSGRAVVEPSAPSAAVGDYRAKYEQRIARMDMTPETFAERYSVPVRIHPTGMRGH